MLFLFCCVGGVSGTPPPLLDLHSTEPVAMELHRSRDEHDIEPAGDFLAVLAHHEVWHLYVDWTRMCQIFFDIQSLVSQVRCVSFGLLLWTMCISFYCGGCGGRSNGLIVRKLDFKYIAFLLSHSEVASALHSLFYR